MTTSRHIKEKAVELGFDLVGIAPAHPPPHLEAYRHWLKNGFHGDMAWMENTERRGDPGRVLAGARSIVVVGSSYYVQDPPQERWTNPLYGRVARYAWGRDYHKVLTPLLKQLSAFISREVGLPLSSRYYVDTGPVLEREYAALSGMGFVGKNTLVISPGFGSLILLGEVLVAAELDYDEPADEQGASVGFEDAEGRMKTATCGSCRRCLDVCPTNAFVAPYVLDSRRCISYLTIESKGAIPVELRPLMGNWIFGCDACQSVCPWVQRYARPGQRPFLDYHEDQAAPSLLELMAMDDEAFLTRFRGTPVMRAKRRGLLRNAAVALGNAGDPEALPVLRKAMDDPEPLVQEHAAWAIEQIETGAST